MSGLPGISRLSFVSAAAMAALLLIRKGRLVVPLWLLWFVALYLYLLIPCLGLPDIPWDAVSGATTVLIGTACIALVLANEVVTLKAVAYAMLAAAILNVIAILLGYNTTPAEYLNSGESRDAGLLGNANVLAINLSLTAMMFWLISGIRLPVRVLSLITAFYGIGVSGSRKGIIFALAILLFVAKKVGETASKLKQIAICAPLLLLTALFYQYADDLLGLLSDKVLAINRISRIFSGRETSFSERKWLIETGYQIWLDAPFFGEGLGQFASISGFGAYSHNNYIELLVSGGVVAFSLYYMLYLLIIFYAIKFRRRQFFYAALLVATLLATDTAMVSFVGRSTMLFITFALIHFSRISENELTMSGMGNNAGRCSAVVGTNIENSRIA